MPAPRPISPPCKTRNPGLPPSSTRTTKPRSALSFDKAGKCRHVEALRKLIMSIQAILLPLFVEVALTLLLLLWLAFLRRNDFTSGAVDPSRIALREPNWPVRTQQVAYSFSNQFELPVLFYVLTILEIITRHADLIFVVLAWIFVIARLGQAYVHTTSNRVLRRGTNYVIGAFVLIVMWAVFMIRILLGLP